MSEYATFVMFIVMLVLFVVGCGIMDWWFHR